MPTDVELGPDGWLYVSSLPGGPEDGRASAPTGRVYKVNPKTGKVKLVAGGFISTVDVAVANNGDVYVAELFTGRIMRIKAGSDKVKPFLQLTHAGRDRVDQGLPLRHRQRPRWAPARSPKGKVIRIAW